MSFATYYLERAALSKEPIEKLRFTSAFLISQLYLSPLQSKPFNPILGETFQCIFGSDTKIYLEHTVHSPPTSNFLVKGKNYIAHGYIITEASIGPNSVKARKSGNFIVRFNDGTIHKIHFPTICIKGTTVGTRTFNFSYNALVSDETNRMAAYFKFNPDKKGTLGKLFGSSQKSFCDTFRYRTRNKLGVKYVTWMMLRWI